ncbi:MAG TPA: tRNA (adenosine(37)-N6)-threonylcarbamoyltransferase complex dimerization subunit type 1 TsaB [Vicinamibacterales bacterium]|jgi:tRNA threonylcarbamoyladenosine biosynthesis protein TsaB
MLVLALDTTTRAGSLALMRDAEMIEVFVGSADRTHATRLPGDLLECLARHGLALRDVDLYGVAAGPGSFTGLRIGIAAIQGLAYANGRLVVPVSALDALACAALEDGQDGRAARPDLVAAVMDAQRGEVFASLYRPAAGYDRRTPLEPLRGPVVAAPEAVFAGWAEDLAGRRVRFAGDGAIRYRDILEHASAGQEVVGATPPLAPAIARIAQRQALADRAVRPHAIKPVYIRRPDAELARDRRAGRRS